MRLYSRLLLLLFIVATNIVFSQENTNQAIQQITVKNGLVSGNVHSISQDSQGFIWIATENGLSRYDGSKIKKYSQTEDGTYGITHDFVNTVAAQNDYGVWVGTISGLDKYDHITGGFKHYYFYTAENATRYFQTVLEIVPLQSGSCFLRTDYAIALYSQEQDSIIQISTLDTVTPTAIELIDENTIVVANSKGKIYTLHEDGTKKDVCNVSREVTNLVVVNDTTILASDIYGNVHLISENEIQKTYSFPYSGVSSSQKRISSIVAITDSTFWVGTEGLGILKLNINGEWTKNAIPQDLLINNNISNLFLDRDKNLWISHIYGGVSLCINKSDQVSYFDCPQEIQNYKTLALAFQNDVLWVGTEGGGLFKYNTKTKQYKQFSVSKGLLGQPFDNVVTSLFYKDGIMWIGTYNKSVYALDIVSNKLLYVEELQRLLKKRVSSVFVDSKNRVWVGTYSKGIYVFDVLKKEFVKHYITDSDNSIQTISCDGITGFKEDSKSNIWVSSYYGISKIAPDGSIKRYTYEKYEGLGNNVVNHIHSDYDGVLWFGTLNGISYYDEQKDSIVAFSPKYGKFSNVISEMISYEENSDLIVTPQAIYSLQKKENRIGYVGACPYGEFSRNAYVLTPTGVLLGTEKGVAHVNLITLSIEEKHRNINLTDVFIGETSVFDRESPYKGEFVDGAFSFSLPYYEDDITFCFSDFTFDNQNIDEYVYKLEGFQEEWISLTEYNFVSYTNLPSGTYKFIVRKNTANGFSEEKLEVNLHIEEPFWEAWWFYVLYFLIPIIILCFIYKARVSKIKRAQNKLQKQVDLRVKDVEEKTQEIEYQKEKVIEQQNIANEQKLEFEKEINNLLLEQEKIKRRIEEKQSELYEAIGEGNVLRAQNEEMEVKLSIISAFSQEMIFRITLPSEKFEYVSDGVKFVTGYEPSDFYNDNKLFRSLLLEEDKLKHKNFRILITKGKVPPVTEYRLVSKGGEQKWVVQFNRLVKDVDGKPMYFEAMIKDVSELRKYKNKEDSASLRFKNLEAITQNQQEVNFEVDGVSIIRSVANLLKSTDISLNEIRAVMSSEQDVVAALQVVGDLIDVLKIDDGDLQLNHSQCYINLLLKDLYKKFQDEKDKTEKKNIDFSLSIPNEDENFSFYTDTFRLFQVLTNLLGNAFKFTPKGSVEFGYEIVDNPEVKATKEILFFVKDSGVGISLEKKAKLFDGYSFDENTNFIHGVGLNLSKKIIELLGGRLWVDSTNELGATFNVALPLEKMKGLKKAEETKEKDESFSLDWSKKTLLLAEDEENNYDFVISSLKRTNIKVIWAKNGEEAISLFEEHQREIDVILMDIQMPKLNGYEATQQIKKIDSDTPIIAQTAYANYEAKLNCFDAGCDNYLAKPYKTRDLIDVLSKYL